MLGDQGIPLRVLDRLHGEVDVEVGPVEMVKLGPLYVQDCRDRGIPEPGETAEGDEQLPICQQEPEAMLGDGNSRAHEGMLADVNKGGLTSRPPHLLIREEAQRFSGSLVSALTESTH